MIVVLRRWVDNILCDIGYDRKRKLGSIVVDIDISGKREGWGEGICWHNIESKTYLFNELQHIYISTTIEA